MLPKKLFCPKCLLPERDQAFRDDLEDFFSYISSNLKDGQLLTYEAYKKFYKAKKISMFHFSKRKEESSKEYYEVLFWEIQSFIFSDNINSKIFSIYTLYSIYYTQITQTYYQINTILEFLREVNSLISNLRKNKNKDSIRIAATIYKMIKKLKDEDAFSIGVIPGLKSIILNKYGIPIEKKENVYTYTKEINNYIKELKAQSQSQEKINNEEKSEKNQLQLDYEMIKKNIVNEIKDLNMNKEDYTNFINNNYNELNCYNCGSTNNLSNNYNKIFNEINLKKEDLTPGEITQLDFLFNNYI